MIQVHSQFAGMKFYRIIAHFSNYDNSCNHALLLTKSLFFWHWIYPYMYTLLARNILGWANACYSDILHNFEYFLLPQWKKLGHVTEKLGHVAEKLGRVAEKLGQTSEQTKSPCTRCTTVMKVAEIVETMVVTFSGLIPSFFPVWNIIIVYS